MRDSTRKGGGRTNYARNPKNVIDAKGETGETWAVTGKTVDKRVFVQYFPTEDIERNAREQRGERNALRAQIRTVESVSPLSFLIRGFRKKSLILPWEDHASSMK